MTKQLVVVVHGVGVKEAGISADLLATALDGDDVPQASDDFVLTEGVEYANGDKLSTYPCRLRRSRTKGGQRTVADFYWGDISNTGTGTLGLLIAIVKTVLGIGHTIRENAKDIYGAGSWLARVADWIVRLIHGPIAAINLVMLSGVLAHWAVLKATGSSNGTIPFAEKLPELAGAVVALVVVAFGIWRYGKHQSFLGRLLYSWVVITGLLLAGSEALNQLSGSGIIAGIDASVERVVCSKEIINQDAVQSAAPAADVLPCATHLASGIFRSGGRLLLLSHFFWISVFGLNILLIVGSALLRLSGRASPTPMLAPVAAAGMTILWMLFLTFVWTAPTAMGWQLLPHADMLESGLVLATAVAVILAALVFAAFAAVIRKSRWKKRAGKSMAANAMAAIYFGDHAKGKPSQTIVEAAGNRLIVNDWFSLVFILGAFFLAFCAAILVYDFASTSGNLKQAASSAVELLRAGTGLVILALGVLGVTLFTRFGAELKMGVDILNDVITYLNDYSWRWKDGAPAKTLLEHGAGPAIRYFSPDAMPGYFRRERIKNRLKTLMHKLIEWERPDNLVIVSHSQGTVVAIDVIAEAGTAWLASMPKGGQISLVTMGSPYTHIHNHYFPSAFKPLSKRPKLAGPRTSKNDRVLTRWTNIFRIDDFVGTHIDPEGKWPEEKPVPANGHTYYWVDTNVAPLLKQALQFGAGAAGIKKK